MPDNNYYKKCGYAEQAVSYLYDEISRDDKAVFETHLKDCSICADDLAGFGSTRSGIACWMESDFQTLGAPEIKFAAAEQSQSNKTTIAARTKAWINHSRRMFAPSPIWAAGLLILLILSGAFLSVRNSLKNAETAAQTDTGKIQVSKPADESTGVTISVAENIAPDSRTSPVDAPSTRTGGIEKNKDNQDNKSPVRRRISSVNTPSSSSKPRQIVSDTAFLKGKYGESGKTLRINSVATRRVSDNKRQIPQLAFIDEDEEDSTPRLADLFDEVGGK